MRKEGIDFRTSDPEGLVRDSSFSCEVIGEPPLWPFQFGPLANARLDSDRISIAKLEWLASVIKDIPERQQLYRAVLNELWLRNNPDIVPQPELPKPIPGVNAASLPPRLTAISGRHNRPRKRSAIVPELGEPQQKRLPHIFT
jgi:hypothetical protein